MGIVADAAERLVRPLKVLEDHLATHAYLVGGRFTVADLNLAEIVRYAQGHGALMEGFPAIRAWLSACQDRPAFQAMWAARMASRNRRESFGAGRAGHKPCRPPPRAMDKRRDPNQ